ncbi:MAG TPA: terminase TerL endonuclease subunit [Hymenobacter sp.]
MKLVECDKYYYDPAAGKRFIELCEKYLYTPEGKPWRFLQWEIDVIDMAYCWKRRDNGERRFRYVYICIGKGNGKSGLLDCIGIFHTLPGWCESLDNQVYCAAANFGQIVKAVFRPAKAIIRNSPRVKAVLELQQRIIRLADEDYPDDASYWEVLTGKGEGKAGLRPSCVLVDELHEHKDRELFDALTSAMGKRVGAAPIMWIATNAGPSRTGVAWEQHDKAVRILEQNAKGEPVEDESFLPVIYAAPESSDWRDINTALACNPAVGELCRADQLEIELAKAMSNPAEEAKYRRYYLSQWVKDTSHSLDQTHWANCTKKPADLPEGYEKWPCVLHLDGSRRDDMTALAMVFYDPKGDMWAVKAKHWMIADTARDYQKKGIDYSTWVGKKQVYLFERPTIDLACKEKLARYIIKLSKKYDVQCLTYDRAYISEVIPRVEAGGVPCIEVKQNSLTLSNPSYELMARLKSGRIAIARNDCLTWQAGNVDFGIDKWHNLYPKKPGADKYEGGRRHLKIDGIVAIISAISEVLRRNVSKLNEAEVQAAALKAWDGKVSMIKWGT